MNTNIKVVDSIARLAGTIRLMRLYLSWAIGSFIILPAAALPNGDSHHLLEEMLAQSQNIKKMIVRYQYGITPPELLYIRSHTNGFYMRITTADQFEGDFQIEETHCGRWNDDYWLYEHGTPPVPGVPAPPPMLMMHSDTANERGGSKAFWTVTHHQGKLNLIRSLGISQVGPDAIKLDGKRFQVMPPDGPFVLTGHFSEFDDEHRPLVAILEYKDNEGVTTTQIQYAYRSNSIYPHRITSHAGFSFEVEAVEFGGPEYKPSRDRFEPPESLLKVPNMSIIIRTNATDFSIRNKQLEALTYGRREDLENRLPARQPLNSGLLSTVQIKTFIVGLMIISFLILFPAMRRK